MPPLLTPDESIYAPLALFKEHQFGSVSLVQEEENVYRVARRIVAPKGVELGPRLAALEGSLKALPGVLTVQPADDSLWIISDYVPGCPLAQIEGYGVPVPRVVQWVAQLLEALDGLHRAFRRPWVVGGFGPTDVIVARDQVVLVDLGLAEHLFPEHAVMFRMPRHTAFIAPEARHTTTFRPSVDLYSVGALAFWLLKGAPPAAPADTFAGVPDLAAPIAELLDTLIAPEADRPRSAQDVLGRLRLFIRSDEPLPEAARPTLRIPIPTTRPAAMLLGPTPLVPEPEAVPPPPPRRWWKPAMLLAAVVACIVAIGGAWRSSKTPEEPLLEVSVRTPLVYRLAEWQPAISLPAGDCLIRTLSRPATVELKPGARLTLAPHSGLAFHTRKVLEVRLYHGRLWVELPMDQELHVSLSAATRVDFAPGSAGGAGLVEGQGYMHNAAGEVVVVHERERTLLKPGATLTSTLAPNSPLRPVDSLPQGWPQPLPSSNN